MSQNPFAMQFGGAPVQSISASKYHCYKNWHIILWKKTEVFSVSYS